MNESTFFASPERTGKEHLKTQFQTIEQTPFITALLNTVSDMVLVLNENRQIIAVNKKLISTFGVIDPTPLIGLRPGEAVGCIHSSEGPNGCGTSETCATCGAVLTILSSQETCKQAGGECRIFISKDGGTALDMEVTATPLNVSGIQFTIFALHDIGSEKRRQVLERTFFHDILNTVGGISGIANFLSDSENLTPESENEYKKIIVDLSENLIEEISQQRRLLSAERGEYIADLRDTDLIELLREVCSLYGNHIRTPDRTVVMEEISNCHVNTDKALLRRILGNMVLNALEATPKGGVVKIAIDKATEDVCIKVINLGVIPKDVQLNLFNRSFSTKGSTGRGIGTYSMKLFGERYLGGKVGFKCSNGETTFFITIHNSPIS